MKQGNRKVDEQARSILANILLFDISDPRLEMVTITDCKVSFDRAYCDVFYTVDPDRYTEVQAAFELAKGHIRSVMSKKIDWKQVPELRFHIDETLDAAARLESYLSKEKDRQHIIDDTVKKGIQL